MRINGKRLEDMTDEELLELSDDPVFDPETPASETPTEPEVPDAAIETAPEPQVVEDTSAPAEEAAATEGDGTTEEGLETAPDAQTETTPEDGGEGDEAAPATAEEPDYKAFYEAIIGSPIKANGKEIKLQNLDEVRRLVQKGAGYGRAMQDLQPIKKIARMLEKANLLDEGKLNYLIDLNQKNPEAIKKLIKESGFDPLLDINQDDNLDYQPRNHGVSDSEMRFQNALTELQSEEGGSETIRTIHTDWDPVSKNAVWESPELLATFNQQRQSGLYDQITAEIERQKLFGTIPPQAPFIEAYRLAGDTLMREGRLAPKQGTAPSAPPTRQVVDRRAAPPKPTASNTDKAKAASATRTAGKPAKVNVNPLAGSDAEFLAQFEGRL